MNKETERIISLLGQGSFLDNVFKFKNKNVNLKNIDTKFENPEYLYHTRNMEDYSFIGVAENKLIASSYDYTEDYSFYNKEEFYLIPFFFFSDEYSNGENLEEMTYANFESTMKLSLNDLSDITYVDAQDMIKYIEWYKEQDYPMYEYIPKLEEFLKEQVEFWKDKFEEIKKYE